MKRVTILVLTLSLMGGTAAVAQPGTPGAGTPTGTPECGQPGQPACPPGRGERGERGERGPRGPSTPEQTPPVGAPGQPAEPTRVPDGPRGPDRPAAAPDNQRNINQDGQRGDRDGRRWSRGERAPQEWRNQRVNDWRAANLRQPPRGYYWACQAGNCFLVAEGTGVIRETRFRDDRDRNWRRRYSRSYTYNDDIYYRDCRGRTDPGRILVGGIIGGLIGNAVGDGRGSATFAGIVIGSSLGAALTRDLDCDDRSYAYRSYYDALNSGRPGVVYRWRNPNNGRRGEFRVRSYYYDADGFSCANYTHRVYFPKRREVRGQACRQPDGAWVFLS